MTRQMYRNGCVIINKQIKHQNSVQLGSISRLFSLISNIFLALPQPGGSGESRITVEGDSP